MTETGRSSVHFKTNFIKSTAAYLLGSTLQFLQTIFQTDDLGLKFCVLLGQQILVESNLLKETLGGGVVVSLLVGKVRYTSLIHRLVHVSHEQ